MRQRFTAIVPVAGAGTRLKPHTNTFPKVLLTVGHKPILGHILDQLEEIGKPEIRMVIGYMGDKIRAYVDSRYPHLNVTYVEQPQPRGLGHAVWLASKGVSGPVFILLGDTILDGDMRQFIEFRESRIGVREVADPRRFGVVEIKDGFVSSLVEKPKEPKSNLAIVGAYSFTDCAALRKNLDGLIRSGKTTGGEIQLTDAIMNMVRHGLKIRPAGIDGWHDCGKPETLLETNRHLLNKHRAKFSPRLPGCLVVPPVYMAKTARAENCIIGPYVSVGEGARISSSIISDTIINENARISSAILNNSLIGPGAALAGAGQQINIGENSEILLNPKSLAE
ncbi:MAG: sugar phosphate nucleotidyltransferase [Elusimicrobiales bacterium]